MSGIYIHIPFCKQACHYCDFHFSTNYQTKSEVLEALHHELELQNNYLVDPVETIYFGGGTPSVLNEDEISDLVDDCKRLFNVVEHPEITLEANPDDLSREKLLGLYAVGINRLSIGIQSFNDEVLKFLNRAHSNKEARQCLQDARSVGFKNISLDLIYGIPGRNDDVWLGDVFTALEVLPEHISAYCLTIEPQTAFGHQYKQGKLTPMDEDAAAWQFDKFLDTLQANGYEQYEVSNFCRNEYYSKHNTAYWQNKHYLGIGPSAHSYNGTTRHYNVNNNIKYMKAIKQDKLPNELEILSNEDKVNEYLMTSLRTKWGISLNQFKLKELLDYSLLEQLVKQKYAILNDDKFILTRKGLLTADKIAADLFI